MNFPSLEEKTIISLPDKFLIHLLELLLLHKALAFIIQNWANAFYQEIDIQNHSIRSYHTPKKYGNERALSSVATTSMELHSLGLPYYFPEKNLGSV